MNPAYKIEANKPNPTVNRIVTASQAMRLAIVDLARAVLKIDACAGYVLHDEHFTVTIEAKRIKNDSTKRPETEQ